jgi:hypothetical protein
MCSSSGCLASARASWRKPSGHAVLYRSIFNLVRDFLHDESLGQEEVPDLLIIDDMGMRQLPRRLGEYPFEVVMRRHKM